uniref:Uncharacterized protein n=1 Tax=Arundo donax TaxID=35708 RepID=A0A0A9HFJ5_ARUDO
MRACLTLRFLYEHSYSSFCFPFRWPLCFLKFPQVKFPQVTFVCVIYPSGVCTY